MSAEAVKEEKKEETKKEEGTKAEAKKEKAKEAPKKVHVKSQKADPNAAIDPRTGTRFAPGSARQLAFEIIYNGAKDGKTIKEVREILNKTKKDSGAAFNLDIGYVNFVVASHPELLECWSDGTFKVIGEPKKDAEAAKKFEEDKENKKKKAEEARAARKEKAKEGSGEKKEKKEKKEEKAEKKESKPDEKPSKKE
jgi:hypothetical protein